MPHSINHGDACLAYFNKIWGIPGASQHLVAALVRLRFASSGQNAWGRGLIDFDALTVAIEHEESQRR
jgi:hypothetical protein